MKIGTPVVFCDGGIATVVLELDRQTGLVRLTLPTRAAYEDPSAEHTVIWQDIEPLKEVLLPQEYFAADLLKQMSEVAKE